MNKWKGESADYNEAIIKEDQSQSWPHIIVMKDPDAVSKMSARKTCLLWTLKGEKPGKNN